MNSCGPPHRRKPLINQVKKSLTTLPLLSFFDINKPTRLCTDTSRQRLGFILQQHSRNMDSNSSWLMFLIRCGNKIRIIEPEMLTVSWAIMKCKLFLAGFQHFNVITDHSPLLSILNTRRLDEIENPRLQRVKSRIMGYNFTAQWTKG